MALFLSSLPPRTSPPPQAHSSQGSSFFAIRRRENADKVDSCCHGNRSPNYCAEPGSPCGRGLGKMRGDGVGKLEMGNSLDPGSPCLWTPPSVPGPLPYILPLPLPLAPWYAPCSPGVASHPLAPQRKGLNTCCLVFEGHRDHKAGSEAKSLHKRWENWLGLGSLFCADPRPGKQLWDPPTHWNPLFPCPSPYPPRTQMTSWWPRLSVQAMMRTWRSVSLVLVSAFPPSPAPGPPRRCWGGGATVCHLAPAQGVLQALASSCSPFVT